jgi:hypothetical protein
VHHRGVATLSVVVVLLTSIIVVLVMRDQPSAPSSVERDNTGYDPTQRRSNTTDSSGSQNMIQYGGLGGAGAGESVRVENDPDRVYGEIYTVSVHCEEVTSPSFGGTLSGYCNWPSGLSGSASCIEEDTTFSMGGGHDYLCKPEYGFSTKSHPDEVTLVNAPEEIYTVEVHCENVTEQFDTTYGDCDWPTYLSPSNDCIEVESRSPFNTGRDFLCKP